MTQNLLRRAKSSLSLAYHTDHKLQGYVPYKAETKEYQTMRQEHATQDCMILDIERCESIQKETRIIEETLQLPNTAPNAWKQKKVAQRHILEWNKWMKKSSTSKSTSHWQGEGKKKRRERDTSKKLAPNCDIYTGKNKTNNIHTSLMSDTSEHWEGIKNIARTSTDPSQNRWGW